MDELRVFVKNNNPDIILLNEVLPKRHRAKRNLVKDTFNLEGYNLILPSTNSGRGVLVYFKAFYL